MSIKPLGDMINQILSGASGTLNESADVAEEPRQKTDRFEPADPQNKEATLMLLSILRMGLEFGNLKDNAVRENSRTIADSIEAETGVRLKLPENVRDLKTVVDTLIKIVNETNSPEEGAIRIKDELEKYVIGDTTVQDKTVVENPAILKAKTEYELSHQKAIVAGTKVLDLPEYQGYEQTNSNKDWEKVLATEGYREYVKAVIKFYEDARAYAKLGGEVENVNSTKKIGLNDIESELNNARATLEWSDRLRNAPENNATAVASQVEDEPAAPQTAEVETPAPVANEPEGAVGSCSSDAECLEKYGVTRKEIDSMLYIIELAASPREEIQARQGEILAKEDELRAVHEKFVRMDETKYPPEVVQAYRDNLGRIKANARDTIQRNTSGFIAGIANGRVDSMSSEDVQGGLSTMLEGAKHARDNGWN